MTHRVRCVMARSLIAGIASILGISCHPAQSPSTMSVAGVSTKDTAVVTAFLHVSVIPMDRERVLQNQTVLVRSGRIIALAPANQVRLPAGAIQIDGRGKFLMPGLADMHTHVQWTDTVGLFLFLANGVTTIRNLDYLPKGALNGLTKLSGPELLQLRAQAATGEILSPRIYTSGPWSDSASSLYTVAVAVMGGKSHLDPGSIAQQVAAYKAAGYDFLKIHDEDRETFDSVVSAAHRVGIPIVGHVPFSMADSAGLERVLAAHYASIEHFTGYIEYLLKRGIMPAWNSFDTSGTSYMAAMQKSLDESRIPIIAAATKRAGVWNCPTQAKVEAQVKLGGIPRAVRVHWPEMQYLSAANNLAITEGMSRLPIPVVPGLDGTLDARRKLIKALQDIGAGLLLGTDTPVAGLLPGFGVHHELAALVRAGLTPYQALATGTRNVAEFFGTLNESGTVAIGKRADLVLLSGNPLQNIQYTTRPAGVMIGGRWLGREELDRRLANDVGKLSLGGGH